MADKGEGLPLEEAVRAYGDPELVAAYDRACQAARGMQRRGYLTMFNGEPIGGRGEAKEIARGNALVKQRERASRSLCRDLIRRLQSGELIATGLEEPLTLNKVRTPILPHLWQVLRPSFKHSAAVGGGLKICAILVRRATAADQERPAVSSAVEEHPAPWPGCACRCPTARAPFDDAQDRGRDAAPCRRRPTARHAQRRKQSPRKLGSND